MKIWIDAQISPSIARWLTENYKVEATPIRDLGLLRAKDEEIYSSAAAAGASVMTKDSDFVRLLETRGPPPQVIWLTCGNTSNQRLKEILSQHWTNAAKLLEEGEPLVEISDAAP